MRLVEGVPKIIFPNIHFEWMMGWMNATDNEVSWRGLADWNEKEFRVTEVFLPIQTASIGTVHVPTAKQGGDFGKWLTGCVRRKTYQRESGECRYKLHMHKHPGSDWNDLHESTIDEDNTAKFGIRDVDWMMVGRGVGSGKFQICLEVFQPFRMSIDHVDISVEFENALYKISDPGQKPRSEDLRVKLGDVSMLGQLVEGRDYFCKVQVSTLTSEQVIRNRNFYYRYVGFQDVGDIVAIKTENVINILGVGLQKPASDHFCVLRKAQGRLMADFCFRVGDWDMRIDDIPVEMKLPASQAIRDAAAKEVVEKVTVLEVKKLKNIPRSRRRTAARARVGRGS